MFSVVLACAESCPTGRAHATTRVLHTKVAAAYPPNRRAGSIQQYFGIFGKSVLKRTVQGDFISVNGNPNYTI